MNNSFQRKRYKLAELLAEIPEHDFSQPRSDEEREWLEMPDVGLEVLEPCLKETAKEVSTDCQPRSAL